MSSPAEIFLESELTDNQWLELLRLSMRVWPSEKGESPEEAAKRRPNPPRPDRRYAVIREGDRVLAMAKAFPREILHEEGSLTVMALAGVCTHPDARGRGFGAAVVRSLFGEVDAGVHPLALFQTGVPQFYLKLECREVTNRFVNRLSKSDPEAIPWWDPHAMIYPAWTDWPEGTIDLNGPGY